MPSFNKVILVGRLTRDPELRHTPSGLAVATFTLAVDRRYKGQDGQRQTDFLRCKAWRQKAEFVDAYIKQGRLVAVEGSIEISEVPGQDGQKRYFTDIVCDNIEPLESGRDRAEGGYAGGSGGNAGGGNADDNGGYFPDEDGGGYNAPQARSAAPEPAAPAPRAASGGQSAGTGRAAPARASAPTGGDAGSARGASSGGAGSGGAAAGGEGRGAGRGAASRPTPPPAYPAEEDFDDSDPFADE